VFAHAIAVATDIDHVTVMHEPVNERGRHADFDQQALLARSGRYPILDYMVG